MSSLRRLGLNWDEGPDIGGDFGPYRQSERLELYARYADELLDASRAFRCYCQPKELEARKAAAIARGEAPRYDGTCRALTGEEEAERRARGVVPTVRFRVEEEEIVVRDLVRGEVRFDASEIGDFVIVKSDGTPTYNFAVVVDDHSMQISHVIRGIGHLANTPRQVMLYRALKSEPPTFVHVPHVLASDGSPLSKRAGARSLREYLDEGYHPEAIINYVSLLSWSSESGEEVLPVDRLVAEIDLERVGASDARIDPAKLEWLSGEHIRRMTAEDLAERLSPYLEEGEYAELARQRVELARAVRDRINTFGQVREFLAQFRPPDPMAWSKEAREALAGQNVEALFRALKVRLEGLGDWDAEAVMDAVRAAGGEIGLKGRALFMPVRAGVTGHTRGPELVDIFAIQGKATTLRVIEQTLAELQRRKEGRDGV